MNIIIAFGKWCFWRILQRSWIGKKMNNSEMLGIGHQPLSDNFKGKNSIVRSRGGTRIYFAVASSREDHRKKKRIGRVSNFPILDRQHRDVDWLGHEKISDNSKREIAVSQHGPPTAVCNCDVMTIIGALGDNQSKARKTEFQTMEMATKMLTTNVIKKCTEIHR